MITGEDHEKMAAAGHLLDDGDLSAPDNEVNYYDVFSEDAGTVLEPSRGGAVLPRRRRLVG